MSESVSVVDKIIAGPQVVSMWEPWNVGALAARDTNEPKDGERC